jgi:hypothetical protein
MTGLHEGRGASLAVLLHGWGGDETSMAVFETAFGPGWRTVRLRAPYPLPGGGYARWIPQADGRPDPRMVQESWRALRGWMEELLHREARGASHRVVVGWTTVGNFIMNSSQNSPGDEEAGEEDEGQEGGKPPFVPNRQPSEPPFQPSEEPLHAASSPPIGLPTPECLLSPSGSLPPPRILRNARPNPSPPQPLPNHLRIIGRIRIYPLRPPPCPPPPALLHPQAPQRLLKPMAVVLIPRPHHHTQGKPIFIHPNARFRHFSLLMPIDSYPFPPFFASTSVESTATASTFTFPSVYPQSRRACRIFCQIPFSWSS